MKRPHLLLRVSAVISSVLLVATFVTFRSGLLGTLMSAPTLAADSTEVPENSDLVYEMNSATLLSRDEPPHPFIVDSKPATESGSEAEQQRINLAFEVQPKAPKSHYKNTGTVVETKRPRVVMSGSKSLSGVMIDVQSNPLVIVGSGITIDHHGSDVVVGANRPRVLMSGSKSFSGPIVDFQLSSSLLIGPVITSGGNVEPNGLTITYAAITPHEAGGIQPMIDTPSRSDKHVGVDTKAVRQVPLTDIRPLTIPLPRQFNLVSDNEFQSEPRESIDRAFTTVLESYPDPLWSDESERNVNKPAEQNQAPTIIMTVPITR